MENVSWDDVTVEMSIGERMLPAILVEVTQRDVVVELPLADAPSLPMGQTIGLVFSGAALPAPVRASGKLVYHGEDSQRVRFRLRLAQGDAGLWSLHLNRRNVVRVAPSPASPVPVRLRKPGASTEASTHVHNLSLTGLSVVLSNEKDGELYAAREVELALRLSPGEDWLPLLGIIRYRTMMGAAVRYGIEFSCESAALMHRAQSRLSDWLMERQRELADEEQRRKRRST